MEKDRLIALELLGLEVGASPKERKKAYRRLAVQHHPDKGGDAEMFKAVHAAYEYLKKEGTGGRNNVEEVLQGAGVDFDDIFGTMEEVFDFISWEEIISRWVRATSIDIEINFTIDMEA